MDNLLLGLTEPSLRLKSIIHLLGPADLHRCFGVIQSVILAEDDVCCHVSDVCAIEFDLRSRRPLSLPRVRQHTESGGVVQFGLILLLLTT